MGIIEVVVAFIGSKKILISLEKNEIIPQIIYCNRTPHLEEGIVNIVLEKGYLNRPHFIPFKIPLNSKLEENETTREILSDKQYYDKRKGQIRFIDCHKLLKHQKNFSFTFKFRRSISYDYIDRKIEMIERETCDGKEIIIKNTSNIEFINHVVSIRCPVPRNVVSNIESPQKESVDNCIKIYSNDKQEIKTNFGRLYMSGKDIDLFIDVHWYINLEPNATKIFNVQYITKELESTPKDKKKKK